MDELTTDWKNAVELLSRWDKGESHLDYLLEQYRFKRLRWLVMECFRTRPVVDRILAAHMKRQPRPHVQQVLRLAVTECLFRESSKHPKVVNTAVGIAGKIGLSKPEAGFVNAVLRSILRKPEALTYSLDETVPNWLLDRWRRQYGVEALALLLEWNSRIPAIMVRGESCPEYAEGTKWDGFFRIIEGRFHEAMEDLGNGVYYVQDPFARIPVELLNIQPGETVMDLCAAPGGKSVHLLHKLEGQGHLIAVDKPGPRLDRLKANLDLVNAGEFSVVESDVRNLADHPQLRQQVPGSVDAVLIDVPCSNTGVIQKRPDVKLRIGEEDILRQSNLQLELISAAANWLRPGGRLVYSTCSLEHEENAGVVERFLKDHSEWNLDDAVLSLPWICEHDGGGAFLLTKPSPA
jgi:16S rRNA (cytosine967-C5)-methyltransferase